MAKTQKATSRKKATRRAPQRRKYASPQADGDEANAGTPAEKPIPPVPVRAPRVASPEKFYPGWLWRALQNPDFALRQDPKAWERMRRDPQIMGPLTRRQLATAGLEWRVEAVEVGSLPPEARAKVLAIDDLDARAAALKQAIGEQQENAEHRAEVIEQIMRRIPRFVELRQNLLEAILRGFAVVEIGIRYNRKSGYFEVHNHWPVHPQKFTFGVSGELRMKDWQSGVDRMWGRELEPAERARLLLHVFGVEDASLTSPEQAGYVYAGRGLADILYPIWLLKQMALQDWGRWFERHALGQTEVRYDPTSDSGASDAENLLDKLASGLGFTVPGITDEDVKVLVKFHEAEAGRPGIFREFITEFCGEQIQLIIEGQTLTSTPASLGLGGGLQGTVHERTKNSYTTYDAGMLDETLTMELLKRLNEWNFPGTAPPRFKSVLDQEQVTETHIARVEAGQRAGLTLAKADVYDAYQLPAPDPDLPEEDLLEPPTQAAPMPGAEPAGGGLSFAHTPAGRMLWALQHPQLRRAVERKVQQWRGQTRSGSPSGDN